MVGQPKPFVYASPLRIRLLLIATLIFITIVVLRAFFSADIDEWFQPAFEAIRSNGVMANLCQNYPSIDDCVGAGFGAKLSYYYR